MHILITGASGFIGQELSSALLLSSASYHLTLTDIDLPAVPPLPTACASRISSIKTDLTNPTSCVSLLSQQQWHACYLLHGVMSTGSESNLELGYRVNLYSHLTILEYLSQHQPGCTVLYTSSLAVYGPSVMEGSSSSLTEHTQLIPQSSYGAQKIMIEALLNDLSRRGLLNGRIMRLPAVVVRPGSPSAAAGSFVSDIVREPMNGRIAVLPVDKSLQVWIGSTSTVVQNLIYMKDVSKERFGLSRTVNMPGLTVTVADIMDTLEVVGGKAKRALIEEKRDLAIERIVESWPGKLDTAKAYEIGMEPEISLLEIIQSYADTLKQKE